MLEIWKHIIRTFCRWLYDTMMYFFKIRYLFPEIFKAYGNNLRSIVLYEKNLVLFA